MISANANKHNISFRGLHIFLQTAGMTAHSSGHQVLDLEPEFPEGGLVNCGNSGTVCILPILHQS